MLDWVELFTEIQTWFTGHKQMYLSITYPFHIPALVESFQPDQNSEEQENGIRNQPLDQDITAPEMHDMMQ